jgi:peptidoglycan/LPS O-acetylase OafA/YrhL
MANKIEFRRDIQILRGFAVLSVLLFHAKESFFPLGFLGVDVFFVVSGYVVTPLILRVFTVELDQRRVLLKLRDFYISRFFRLAPALVAFLIVSTVLIFLLGPPTDHQRIARQGIATLLLVGNLGAIEFSGNYFSPNPNPLVHTWSLSVEEQIYIFLPIVLLTVLLVRSNRKRIFLAIFMLFTLTSLVLFLIPTIGYPLYSIFGIESPSRFSFYSTIERLWQFTSGGLAYLMLRDNRRLSGIIPRKLHSVLIISLFAFLLGQFHFSIKASSLIATSLTLLVLMFRSLELLPKPMSYILTWLGDRSYSIYLIHMPLLYIAKFSPATQLSFREDRVVQTLIGVFFSIVFGSASYKFIENRFRLKGDVDVKSIKKLLRTLILIYFAALVSLVIMDRGSQNQYWGLDKNIPQPPYAGAMDPKCMRDSEMGPPCFYLVPKSNKTVLLIGDSHAGDISEALVRSAKVSNWNAIIWTHSGCNIYFQSIKTDRYLEQCLTNNLEMKEWILREKPDAIVISQFIRSSSPQKVLRSALLSLRNAVPNVLLIENRPIFPDKDKFMVARPLFMSSYAPPKQFKKSQMQTIDKKSSESLATWARKNDISTMSFESLFCDNQVCRRFSEADWLYRDDDHFSIAGANLAIPQLREYLGRLSQSIDTDELTP